MNDAEKYAYYLKTFSNEIYVKNIIKRNLENLANKLIECLYYPDVEDMFKPDWYRIEQEGIDPKEAINWANLKVCGVEEDKDNWIITIDNAEPECSTFIEYIEFYLIAWGWNVEVQTEW